MLPTQIRIMKEVTTVREKVTMLGSKQKIATDTPSNVTPSAKDKLKMKLITFILLNTIKKSSFILRNEYVS